MPTQVVHVNFARKLEREREEAREAWYEMQSSFERSRDEVENLIRARDEARSIAAEYSFALEDTVLKVAGALKRWKKSK